MAGCLPPMDDKMLSTLATMLTQSDFLGVLSDLTCTTTLPVECDISTAPATNGVDWLNNCGQWVIVNIYDGGEAVNTNNLVNLCSIVTESNLLQTTTSSSRMMASSGAGVATMPTSSDVTLKDDKIIVSAAVISATTSNVSVANTTATAVVGYSPTALSNLNVTAAKLSSDGTVSKSSSFIASVSLMMIVGVISSILF